MDKTEHRSASKQSYLLGTHDDELDRLGFQHRVWARQAFEVWERAGVAPRQTVLDLGCGPGFTTLDLASLVGPEGHVIAVDASHRYIEHVRKRCAELGLAQVEPLVGDVHDLDLPPSSLDVAYARWLFCFVRDPQDVVHTVAKALKPNGILAVMDYCNYEAICLQPPSDALKTVARAVCKSWERSGGNLNIGGELPGMMAQAGLEIRDIVPIVRVARPGTALWAWPQTFFATYLDTLKGMQLITEAERVAFWSDWNNRADNPAAFLMTPPMCSIIAVKPINESSTASRQTRPR